MLRGAVSRPAIHPHTPEEKHVDPGAPYSRAPSTGAGSISSSLLARVKGRDADAWRRLVKLYGPLVYDRSRQAGLQAEDAADVVQEGFAAVAAPAAVVVTTILVVLDEYLIDFGSWLPWLPNVLCNGLGPTALLFAGLLGIDIWLRGRLNASRVEREQTLFVVVLVGFATLTTIGAWFRGPGMVLAW